MTPGRYILTPQADRSKPLLIDLISATPADQHPDIMCEPNSPWLAIEFITADSTTKTVRLWTCLPEHLVPV